jgi:hypothetical protein
VTLKRDVPVEFPLSTFARVETDPEIFTCVPVANGIDALFGPAPDEAEIAASLRGGRMSEGAGHMLRVDRPVPGYYRTKMVRNGPWVPVRIWEEDGEMKAERNGRPIHAQSVWIFCANNPITRSSTR